MKKMGKIFTAILMAAVLVMCVVPVSAEHYWNYDIKFQAAFGSPDINGAIGAGEWDDAPAIEIALNGDPMFEKDFMSFQGSWESEREDSDYKGVYKVKWDENYIYFLEDRTDNHVNLNGDAEQPWTTDGALVFTQADSADGSLNPEGISVHVFYSVGNGSGAAGGTVMARVCNIADSTRETIPIPDAKVASSVRDGGFIVEVAVPLAFYKGYTLAFTPAAGTVMGLSYVVHDSDSDDTGYEKQFCYARDDSLDAPGGYDFGNWGTLEFLAAPVVTLPAELPTEPAPAEEIPETVVSTTEAPVQAAAPVQAPKTNDSAVYIIMLGAAAFAAAMTAVKSKRNAKI